MRILFRAGEDLRKWADSVILQMGRLRLKEAAGSRTWSCIQAFPASGRCARAGGDPQMGNGFCSSLGPESGLKGPWDHLRGFGWRGNGSVGGWAQVRPWGGLLTGGKGAVVSLVVRRGQWQRLAAEKLTRKEKRARGREKILTKKCRTMNSKGRWLAKLSSLASLQVFSGSIFLRGSFL